jgi:hypothetical protein
MCMPGGTAGATAKVRRWREMGGGNELFSHGEC